MATVERISGNPSKIVITEAGGLVMTLYSPPSVNGGWCGKNGNYSNRVEVYNPTSSARKITRFVFPAASGTGQVYGTGSGGYYHPYNGLGGTVTIRFTYKGVEQSKQSTSKAIPKNETGSSSSFGNFPGLEDNLYRYETLVFSSDTEIPSGSTYTFYLPHDASCPPDGSGTLLVVNSWGFDLVSEEATKYRDVVCYDYSTRGGTQLGSQSARTYKVGDTASGSDWGTSSPYSGYSYSSATSITVKDEAGQYVTRSFAPATYAVSYSANGGSGSVASQTKYHDETLTLATAAGLSKSYTVTFNANGGKRSASSSATTWTSTPSCSINASKTWNTRSDGTGSVYSQGGSYTSNSAVTLYAIWSNPTLGSLETPYRYGYVFAGWNTKSDGTGSYVTSSTVVSGNATYYAIWATTPIWRYDGTQWVKLIPSGSTSSDVPNVYKYDGSKWSRQAKVYRYDGTKWVQMKG